MLNGVDNGDTVRRLLDDGDGLVTRQQLRRAGVGQRWLHRRLADGDLVQILPGVIAAAPGQDPHLWMRAALLQAGPDAALTHVTALANWGLWRGPALPPHVAVPRPGARQATGMRIHTRPPGPWVVHNGLPTVEPCEALVAAAFDLSIDALRFVAMEAIWLGLMTPSDLAGTKGRPRQVMGKLRLLAEEAAAGAESGGEAKYWRLLKESHLPTPRLQVWLQTARGWKRLDAYWDEIQLGVEIDGWENHGTKEAFGRDRRRQNAVHGTGAVLIQFSVDQVMNDPEYVLEDTEANYIARSAWLRRRVSGLS